MRFGVLADIHGNSFALEAVLQDMAELRVPLAVNLGDFFSGPIEAGATAELLRENEFVSIRGNHDRYLIEQDRSEMGPSDRVAFDQLDAATLDWISSLSPTKMFFDSVFLCHGTPRCDSDYWLERVEENGLVRAAKLKEVETEARGIEASLFLCAHTHIPRCVRLPDGRTIVNPGSVGCPGYDDDLPFHHHMQTGSPNASYAIVERRQGDWITTFRSIPYDWRKASDSARRNGRPEWARALETGWFEKS